MNTIKTPEIQEVLEAVHYRPAVSIILPFEHKFNLQNELTHSLKIAVDRAEEEISKKYPEETGQEVIKKLRAIVKNTSFDSTRKSIAIYVSPVFEKLLYLDVPVEEKIIVDDSFEIRDLVFNQKQSNKYLVLLLSAKHSRILLGGPDGYLHILPKTEKFAMAVVDDAPDKVANFSDMSARKEIVMEKFLRMMDEVLDDTRKAYPLPIFIMGAERTMGHFKTITKHADAVIGYIPGNYEESTPVELKAILQPYFASWRKKKEGDLLRMMEEAANQKKLAVGIREVWREAMNRKGRLLVVENNYMYAARQGGSPNAIYRKTASDEKIAFIKDAVDDIIENVLSSGGDVEFVDEGTLKDFHHIALIQFY